MAFLQTDVEPDMADVTGGEQFAVSPTAYSPVSMLTLSLDMVEIEAATWLPSAVQSESESLRDRRRVSVTIGKLVKPLAITSRLKSWLTRELAVVSIQ